jgi:hypothetical protein
MRAGRRFRLEVQSILPQDFVMMNGGHVTGFRAITGLPHYLSRNLLWLRIDLIMLAANSFVLSR